MKDEEIKLYGEFRTSRLVLEAWDKLEGVAVEGYKAPDVLDLKCAKIEQPEEVALLAQFSSTRNAFSVNWELTI